MKRAALSYFNVLLSRGKLYLLVWLMALGGSTLQAQTFKSNIRFNSYAIQTDTLTLDTLSIVPGTVIVRSTEGVVDTADYIIKAFESKLIWVNKPAADSIRVFYRVYPFALARETSHKNYGEYKAYSANTIARPFFYAPEEVQGNLIDFGSLNYNGSFSRSVSFGSNQDVVLNSLFNLQLSGMLTRDLEISAAITDNNIPIQPEGNTQQLQEFDKIFIQLRKDQHKVIVGDYDLAGPANDYFLRFTKKYKGGLYTGAYDIKKLGVFRVGAGGGIARGKFARNTLVVSEGNQGPYKLTGGAGEVLITILANSEQVFINGAKMERGADRDYIIDYNVGEITFMPRRVISKDLRIIIEFQYSNNDYSRSAAYLATALETKKVDVRFNLFSEQDSKNQNIQQNLDGNKKAFLSTIGDSIQNAFYSGYDSVGFDANRILYALVDTVVEGTPYDSVLVYSTDSTTARYAVSFTLSNDGLGDYVPASNTANGRVYQWVAPVVDSDGNVRHQGTYRPQIFIVTPKYQQMYTLAADYRINKNNTVYTEVALSNTDPNMFSKIDNPNHLGFAGRVKYVGSVATKKDTAQQEKQKIVYDVDYEFIQNKFTTIERFRNVEFARDWNLGNLSTQSYNQHLAVANIGYVWNGLGNINYRFKTFLQDSVYQGYETGINGNFAARGIVAVFSGSYLHSQSLTSTSDYIRPKADLSYGIKKLKGLRVGAVFDHEINRIKNRNADTLSGASFLWQNYKAYIGTPDSSRNKYVLEFTMRYEHKPYGNSFLKPFYGAQGVNFTGLINSFKGQTLGINLSYRHARNEDSLLNSSQPEHFYLGRIDYNVGFLQNVFRLGTLYEMGTGRQQKIQIVFQPSPTNQGDWIWKDDNEDGAKQLQEFKPVPAGPPTGDTLYLKLAIPTAEFVSVNTNQFNQILNINPAAVWKNKSDARKIVAMFSLFASVQITKKTYAARDKKFISYFNPVPLAREDSQLVATAINSRNSLYFNRLSPKYGAQVDFNYLRNRTLLTSGFENRLARSQGGLVRWNIVKSFNTQFSYYNGLRSNESDFYTNLRYRFTYNDFNADVNYQFGTVLRIGFKYDFSMKVNPNDSVGNQTGQVNKLTFEARYNTLKKNTLNASIAYASIVYRDKGLPNQQLEYAMLEGLLDKNNLVWSIGYSQNLTANIQMTLSYDGRMAGFVPGDKSTIKPIHTGRAELRALF